MRIKKRIFLLSLVLLVSGLSAFYFTTPGKEPSSSPAGPASPTPAGISRKQLSAAWTELSGGLEAKVIFARPPFMYVLVLPSGELKKIPNVTVAGAKGRRKRGKSPRPFWAPDGTRFAYRYDGAVYVCDESGNKTLIQNPQMDCSDETRWSWFRWEDTDWLAGPSVDGNVILVKSTDPSQIKTAYAGGDVEKHCEITGEGRVVYDNGSDIYVTALFSKAKGIKISHGQSCRPCASPDKRAAWLTVPHNKYLIHDAVSGDFLGPLPATDGEELYRMNWSNFPDFTVHMYGSSGNTRMHVRRVGTGESLFIGSGWDPDIVVLPATGKKK
ncbi:MAG: hypothetical protein GY765_09320 [bacterium]|nr:hypothetical protein [bacterium]